VVNFSVTNGFASPGDDSATSAQASPAPHCDHHHGGQINITASAGGKSVTFTLTARQPGVDPNTVVFLNAP